MTNPNLKSCAACGHKISIQASVCPQCGHGNVQEKGESLGFTIFSVGTVIALAMFGYAYLMPKQPTRAVGALKTGEEKCITSLVGLKQLKLISEKTQITSYANFSEFEQQLDTETKAGLNFVASSDDIVCFLIDLPTIRYVSIASPDGKRIRYLSKSSAAGLQVLINR